MNMQAWPRMYEVVNGQIVRRSLGGGGQTIDLSTADLVLASYKRLSRSAGAPDYMRAMVDDLESALAVAKSEMEMTDDRT